MFGQIDPGAQGSEGPWLVWAARATHCGTVSGKTFYIRDKDNVKTPFDAANGMVIDTESLKTGWQQSGGVKGVAPKWVWGASPAQLPEKPGDDYKKGFQMRVALGGGRTATWEQAGAAVYDALVDLSRAESKGAPGQLPLVKLTGVQDINFSVGSTTKPVLTVAEWVDRPDCLKTGMEAIDTGPAEQQQATATTPPPAAATAPAANHVPSGASF